MAGLNRPTWDVTVIGAGPAGSAVAGFLARQGLHVLVLDKDQCPRFHIGESLLPRSVPILLDLGIDLAQHPFALKKEGAFFLNEGTEEWFRFDFSRTLPGTFPYAYQVVRSEFDRELARTAASLGAEVRFNLAVSAYEESDTHVRVDCGEETFQTRYLIDATGQDALSARRQQRRRLLRGFGKCATFTHFADVRSPAALEAFHRGDIIILVLQTSCWGWAIPLPGHRLSLGVVTRDGTPVPDKERALPDFVSRFPRLQSILEGSVQDAPLRRISDFSYYNDALATPRVVALGDAHGFLDPIFSSGITLSLYTASRLTRHVVRACVKDQPLELAEYYADIRRGYETFERIIERFYRPGWAQTTFFLEDKPEDLVTQMTTILAGDVWRDDNPYQNLLLKNRRRPVNS